MEGAHAIKKRKQLPKIGKRTVKNEFEWKIYGQLCELFTKSRVEYESEKIPYTISHTYLPDLKVISKSGHEFYVEAKGGGRAFDSTVRAKMVAVKEQHPELDIRMIFYSDGKIGPKRKNGSFMRQSDWATKNGFKFAIGNIPEDWVNDL